MLLVLFCVVVYICMGMLDCVFITLSNRFKTDNAFAALWGAPLKKFILGVLGRSVWRQIFCIKHISLRKKQRARGLSSDSKLFFLPTFSNLPQILQSANLPIKVAWCGCSVISKNKRIFHTVQYLSFFFFFKDNNKKRLQSLQLYLSMSRSKANSFYGRTPAVH